MVDRVQVQADEGLTNTPADKPKSETTAPENFPEKFLGEDGKPDYDKLSKSYNELEKAFTKKQQVSKDGTVEGDAPQGDEENTEKTAKEEIEEQVKSALPGFTDAQIEEFSAQAFETGELTEDQYNALEGAGYSKEIVDQYIQGQLALSEAAEAQIVNAGGGQEQVERMFDWARENLTEQQIAAYDKKFADGGSEAIMAMEHLKAKYDGAGFGSGGSRVTGANAPRGNTDTFKSVEQVREAMADPRYKNDPAYRKAVAEKIGRSNVL